MPEVAISAEPQRRRFFSSANIRQGPRTGTATEDSRPQGLNPAHFVASNKFARRALALRSVSCLGHRRISLGRAQDGSVRIARGSAGGAACGVPGLQWALGAGRPAAEPQARPGLLLRAVRQPGAARRCRKARLLPTEDPSAALGLTGRATAGPPPPLSLACSSAPTTPLRPPRDGRVSCDAPRGGRSVRAPAPAGRGQGAAPAAMLCPLLLLAVGAVVALGRPSDRTPWDSEARDLLALRYLSGEGRGVRPAWPKRALSLFAHWRPQYTPGGDEPELPSDISGRPHGLPLRWG
ncbi:uncharacterized protein [Dermacentor albipictus]|uniref:uncharacterized protein n=1 Tax=Dermacentor albipictus TaxID=60249 RepID=UPI0038FC1854